MFDEAYDPRKRIMLLSIQLKSIIFVFCCLIPLTMGSCGLGDMCSCGTNCNCANKYLSTMELMDRFDQEGTEFNDERSCWRVCDGEPRTCYYNFMLEHYDTMSGLCGNCANKTISDCSNAGCITVNGVERNVMTINRGIPGPAINVCKGDRIIIDVMNHMHGCETGIHWHGILQTKTPYMDGVPMITQCPIASGTTFRYDFEAEGPTTSWYHSHSGCQRTNGVFGSLIMRDKNDPNEDYYDTDLPQHTIVITDWLNVICEEYMPGIQSKPLRPDSILINGRGTYNLTGNTTYAPLAVFYVQRNKRTLFRSINAGSMNCPTELSIEGCKLNVIAADGYPIYPVTVDRIIFQPGERYDFVIIPPKNRRITQMLLTVRAMGNCAQQALQEFGKIFIVDNLYMHEPRIEDAEPILLRPTYQSLDNTNATYLNHPNTNCSDLSAKDYCIPRLVQKGVPYQTEQNLRNAKIEKRIYLEFRNTLGTFRPMSYLTVRNVSLISMINNISMTHPPLPLLTQNSSGVQFCDAENLPSSCSPLKDCQCLHVIKLKLCKVYEFHLFDDGVPGGTISHPFHMHGYGFQVVDMGFKSQLRNGTSPYPNLKSLPPVKDTVSIPSGGYARIRIKACNPGFWLFHCHYEYHMITGMMAVFQVGEPEDMVKPPANFPKCGDYIPLTKIPADQIKDLPPRDMEHHTNTQADSDEEMPFNHSMM